jgi:hypothetical protein
MKITLKKSYKIEMYWALKKITGTWILIGMRLKKEARESGIATEV